MNGRVPMDWAESLQLERIQGVDVELDHAVPEGWEWRFESDQYVVSGPAGRSWKPTVKRLVSFLHYLSGALVRTLDDGSIELLTWREPSGVGFRVLFVRTGREAPVESKEQ